MSKTVLTGIRANNDLQLGNYLGAILPMVNIQKQLGKDDKLYMFVPDLHSFTTPIDHSKLADQTLDNIRVFLAAGLSASNRQTTLYRQSRISAHSELAWILSCFTYFGEASRMTEFKDKVSRLGNKSISVGLFNYPILMAGDIFLYSADYIPLGDDQKQHMELARTLAKRFNNQFGNTITVPKSWDEQLKFSGREASVRIRSLSDPVKKMSKSIEDPKGTIKMLDKPKEAAAKIMSATTDSVGTVHFDFVKQPGISNLIQILALLSDKPISSIAKQWDGSKSYGDLKKATAEVVEKFLTSFQAKYAKTSSQDIEKILKAGEKKASQVASTKLLEIQKAIGLY